MPHATTAQQVNPLTQAQRGLDPYGMVSSVAAAQWAWLTHPQELSEAISTFFVDSVAFQSHLTRLALGLPSEDVIKPHVDDLRFADPQWNDYPTWDVVKECYLAITHRMEDLLFASPGLSEKQRKQSAFWARQWLNALAPTNFFLCNPTAMRRSIDSQGDSLRHGMMNLWRDSQAGKIRMVDPDAFRVGVDLATTPGHVVLRNRLMELIHYTPSTTQVHQTPIVIVTPWINKYYVLDLTPDKSLVKFLTDQGYSVFITSWKNPTADMADIRFDDYLLDGVDQAVQAACRICDVPQVHLTGYCIGGTLVSTYMAWADRHYGANKHPVAHWTLFATLTNFSEPGDIEVFIDEESIAALEQKMAQSGFLDGSDMASSFRLLRSNSLIWHYFEHSYLLGEPLPASDVMFWNMDTTRMPAAMHSFYLRQMYLYNQLVQPDALSIGGEWIDLSRVSQALYAVGCQDDHIVPWQQSYRIRHHVHPSAPIRFVLTNSGHIFGIVNPVRTPPKRNYWAGNAERGEASQQWLERSPKQAGSWWSDWLDWLSTRCGPMVAPPKISAKTVTALGSAPGTYVFEH